MAEVLYAGALVLALAATGTVALVIAFRLSKGQG